MARTAELPERLAKDKLRRLISADSEATHPNTSDPQHPEIRYNGITIGVEPAMDHVNLSNGRIHDRKEVGANLLTALHVMLQPGCHSWKRQLLSPSPAHSNHQGHPKKPCECNSNVFMCDSKPVAQHLHA